MRKSVIPRMRRCAALAISLALSVLTLAFSGTDKGKNKAAVNSDEYNDLMTYAVRDIYDLEQYFVLHQYDFLPIAPPDPHFILQQPGVPDVLPFTEKTFPKEFVEHLVGTYEYSVLVYPLNIREDPKTREIVFINADGQPIYTLPPAPGYDPYAYLKSRWATLYSGQASLHAVSYWQGVYDPARVQLRTKLIATENVEPYLYARAKVMEAAALQQEDDPGGEMLMLMSGEEDLTIVGMAQETNGLRIELEYSAGSGTVWSAYSYDAPACVFTNGSGGSGGDPPPLPGTNACTNCVHHCAANPTNSFMGLERIWEVVYTNLQLTGATHTTWTDTRPIGIDAQTNHINRYYGFGRNADHDGDGLNSGIELFVVKSDPENEDTDSDGIPDGWEWNNGHNPLHASDATDDPDSDGLSNLEEYQNGTDPFNPDTDADGFTDGYEADVGTDPLDETESPGLIMVINNNAEYTRSTNLLIRFPGYLADNAIIGEQLTNAVTLSYADPIPYGLHNTSNGVRNLYARIIRNSETSVVVKGSIILDTLPPNLGGFSPTNGHTTNRRWIKITGLATDALSQVRTFVNEEWAHGSTATSFWHDRILLHQGTNPMVVVARDMAGNTTTQTVAIIQNTTGDTTAPSLSVSLPGQTTNGALVVYGDNPSLYFTGSTDDETAEVLTYAIVNAITNGPWEAVVSSTQIWGNATLAPGTNRLNVIASDAAGNASTSTCLVVRDTNFFFTITYPVPYQVMNAASTVVSGIASPMFLNSTITVNGVATTIADHGSNIVFATVSGVPLSVGRTELIAVADINGTTYYTDPPPVGYKILSATDHWVYTFDLYANYPCLEDIYYSKLYSLMNWDSQSKLYHEQGTYEEYIRCRDFCSGQSCDDAPPEFNSSEYLETPDFMLFFGRYEWRVDFSSEYTDYWSDGGYSKYSELRYIKYGPTQETQFVIFQFPRMWVQTNAWSSWFWALVDDPSTITYKGQTGFWYNGNIAFAVPIKTEVESTIKESDFTWPGNYTPIYTTFPSWGYDKSRRLAIDVRITDEEISVSLLSDRAANSPKEFKTGRTDPDFPCGKKLEEAEALVVYYNDVFDYGTKVVDDFDVTLKVAPADLTGVTWSKVGGPNSGSLINASQAEATFRNPKVGGVYQFEGMIQSLATRTQLLLPLGGPDVTAYYNSEFSRYDQWLEDLRSRLESYSVVTRWARLRTSVYRTVNSMNYKYDSWVANNSPCETYTDGTVTLCGHVLGADQLGNIMYAYTFARSELFFTTAWLGGHVAQLWSTRNFDSSDDQAAYAAGYAFGENGGIFCDYLTPLGVPVYHVAPVEEMQTETATRAWPSQEPLPQEQWREYPTFLPPAIP